MCIAFVRLGKKLLECFAWMRIHFQNRQKVHETSASGEIDVLQASSFGANRRHSSPFFSGRGKR